MAHLEIILPDGTRRAHPLSDQPIIIGREQGCTIHLHSESASRRHAHIIRTREGYRIEDLGSVNGTWVNNQRVKSAVLRDGDILAIQDFEARFVEDGAGSAVTLADFGGIEPFRSRAGAVGDLEISHLRLKSLYELTSRLTALRDLPALLEDALAVCCEVLKFERGAIGLKLGPRRGMEWPAVRNLRGADGGLTLSRTMLSRALEGKERLIFGGTHHDLPATQSMVALNIQAAMCVPLVYEGEVLGVIYGDRVTPGRAYSDEDADFFFALAGQVSIGVMNARLLEQHKAHLRLEQEVTLAREAQKLLFPKVPPDGDGVRMAALNVPGRRVSGDHYDLLRMGNGRYALLVADVTGKGVAASLLGGSLHGMARATLGRDCEPAQLLRGWNEVICGATDGLRFVTCALMLVDAAARQMTVAVAGHPRPLVLQPDEKRILEIDYSVGVPLGVLEGYEYTATTVTLPAQRCTMLLYTDGVIEAMDAAREEFGDERLAATAIASSGKSPNDLLNDIDRAVRDFAGDSQQYDDITMVALELAARAG